MNNFAKNLTELLKEKGTSQRQLADALGVKQQTISRYIKGNREPDIDTIIAIAIFFEITVGYLLGTED